MDHDLDEPGLTATTQRLLKSSAGKDIEVGPLRADENELLFALFAAVVAAGDGYPHSPPLTRESFDSTWIRPVTMVVGARAAGQLVGAYYLKPNFPGRGSHIANAGYVVRREHRRQGVGRLLVEDSIWRAPMLGFDAIQFNFVFASNPARALYEELGWQLIGTIPDAVEGGPALIYWRSVIDR